MLSLRFRRPAAALLLLASLGLAACGGGDDDGGGGDAGGSGGGTAAAATVDLKPTTFEPDEVTVKVGEAVTWKWGSGVQHNVKFDDFESELMSKGEFSHTFDEAGTFTYTCEVHPTTMKGTVEVTA
ncbi:MAG: plastocyanin/azurin family copper-binding protein [Actinomycetota bacterium]|nr:plastocyanin/azurin family copper-binding protein [Actinomycetota bacterium]